MYLYSPVWCWCFLSCAECCCYCCNCSCLVVYHSSCTLSDLQILARASLLAGAAIACAFVSFEIDHWIVTNEKSNRRIALFLVVLFFQFNSNNKLLTINLKRTVSQGDSETTRSLWTGGPEASWIERKSSRHIIIIIARKMAPPQAVRPTLDRLP